MAQLAAQLLAGGVELAALPADAARPRVFSKRVNHCAADATLGEGLELDAATLVEAVRRVDQAEHAVLDEISDVDRIRHRRRHASSQRLDEGQQAAVDKEQLAVPVAVGEGAEALRAQGHRAVQVDVVGSLHRG